MVDWAEFHEGLAETRRYLLSHHEPEDYYRTYAVSIMGRRVRLCARCTGIYPGILLGILFGAPRIGGVAAIHLILVLPLPALVDWAMTRFTGAAGTNLSRTATGVALGYAYGLGVIALLVDGDVRVVPIGAGYAIVAGTLLALQRERYE